MWMVRIYVGRDPEREAQIYRRVDSRRPARRTGPHQPHARGAGPRPQHPLLPANPWTSISITGSISVPGRGCGRRAFATTRPCSHGVRPPLGARLHGELSPVEIQTLYSELLNRKLSARTIRYTHAVLFSALRQAVRWKLLLTNPAEDLDLPSQPRRRFTVFDVEQAKRFIAAISGHKYKTLFALAITTACGPANISRSPGRISILSVAQ
jgi:hypothetical protein